MVTMREFHVDVPDADLADLRARIDATRWPGTDYGDGWDRGVPQTYLKDLAGHWSSRYDWRAAEANLNKVPQYVTEIDGADIHFLHIESPEPGARPLLLTHSWPGSVVEFREVVGPLTDPRAHGGDPADAFHLVVPSLPGHGFSGPEVPPGWDVPRVARALAELMRRLGYDCYLAGGGDWGSFIALELGRIDPEHLLGAHVTCLIAMPTGAPEEMSGLSDVDQTRVAKLSRYDAELSAYLRLLSTRPLTVAYGLTDSPVGQLAWIVEKFYEWTDSTTSPEDAVDRERLLTNASIYWLTGTAASSAQLYHASAAYLGALFDPSAPREPVTVPIGVAVFDADPIAPVRVFAEREHPTIVHWSEFDKGGHFGAMEQPGLFAADVAAFARARA
jgi:epoxide hydrolase